MAEKTIAVKIPVGRPAYVQTSEVRYDAKGCWLGREVILFQETFSKGKRSVFSKFLAVLSVVVSVSISRTLCKLASIQQAALKAIRNSAVAANNELYGRERRCIRMPDIDIHDPKYRFDERVQRLIGRGRTKHEAEEIVEFVIRTKEGLTKSELKDSVEP